MIAQVYSKIKYGKVFLFLAPPTTSEDVTTVGTQSCPIKITVTDADSQYKDLYRKPRPQDLILVKQDQTEKYSSDYLKMTSPDDVIEQCDSPERNRLSRYISKFNTICLHLL